MFLITIFTGPAHYFPRKTSPFSYLMNISSLRPSTIGLYSISGLDFK
jgi:hypothetical protein